ncbi:MAG: hypothetical protein JSU08_12340 [Acidobacteria bacterium]|nr:hypothetical protein [Acidobacteriota bacterium]
MRVQWYAAALMALVFTTAACGKSNEEKAAEQIQKSAEELQKNSGDMEKSAENLAKGFEAMAKGLAGGDPDAKPVDPVSFRDLQGIMPESVGGWERGKPTGEKMTAPFAYSQASVTYKKGDAEIEQKIMDSGFNQLLFAPFSMMMAAGYEKETEDGFERSVKVNDNPGWEKWDKGTRNGELSVVVAKRFLVQLEGRGIDDVKTLRTVLDQTDLKKLASLK